MGILSISLFLLGVVFLLLGWRLQSPPSEEVMTALKGVASLKKELMRVQDQVQEQVQGLEAKLHRAELHEQRVAERKETELRETEKRVLEQRETEQIVAEPQRPISPKYQEVLQLAALGQGIPEIAQHLFLSQDAVRMVIQTHSKGGSR